RECLFRARLRRSHRLRRLKLRYRTCARKYWPGTAGLMALVNVSVEPLTIFVCIGVQFCKSLETSTTTVSPAESPDNVVCTWPPLTEKPPKTGAGGLYVTVICFWLELL